MSLDDMFNKNDGSDIDIVDSMLLNFHHDMAVKWQETTKRSKTDLEAGFYLATAVCVGGQALAIKSYLGLLFSATCATQAFYKSLRPRSNLDDQLDAEMRGLPSKTLKYIYAGTYFAGIFALGSNSLALIGYAIEERPEKVIEFIPTFMQSIGLLLWPTANYISKCNVDPPPPKPKKKPIYERIKEYAGELLPQPLPQPVRTYSKVD